MNVTEHEPASAAAAAVRSTHESARARARARTHAHARSRAPCIHKVPDIWRARARDSPPPPSLFPGVATLPGLSSQQPFASSASYVFPLSGDVHAFLAREASGVYFHRFVKTVGNKSFHFAEAHRQYSRLQDL